MPPVARKPPAEDADDPVDRLVISLRSYVTRPKKTTKTEGMKYEGQAKPDFQTHQMASSDWVLVFDCETTTTPDQKLKFGTYQLRHQGRLAERGFFYEPAALTAEELAVLRTAKANERSSEAGEKITLRTRHEFVEHVFFGKGRNIGAQIVGFNLPFDISRLAVTHVNAEREMFGGFSFILIDDENWSKVAVKHLSQRMSFIGFRGTEANNNKRRNNDNDDDEGASIEDSPGVDRGFFVDVKTLAAALTSESHSLESLGELLKIPNPKLETEGHGGKLTLAKVRYAQRDTQATWECYEILAKQFKALQLTDTGLYDLYSEASLGKAYLKTMGIKPWQEVQPKFPAKTIGRILSTYYGGRSEVHIRREITPVIHFDFLSMYPTVCTLMKLWPFSISNGVKEIDATARVKQFVSKCTPETMRGQAAWQNLNAIVRVLPRYGLFPVRAHYADDAPATIGLNYLTSDQPMWFTLADVLVSKILTGRTPEILEAISFEPIGRQEGLKILWAKLDSDRCPWQSEVATQTTLETAMKVLADQAEAPSAIHTDIRAIFVSMELSRSSWLITSVSPGGGEKMSKHAVAAGNIAGLLEWLAQLKEKAHARTGRDTQIITIQEAGLDGFWIHRVLQSERIESHVVDPASILTSRRRRRAKTDKIDGETLVRTLLAHKRGEPRVCAMVKVPTPDEEDRRRLCRERKTLVAERVEHVNRIKGLLFTQGIYDYEPLKRKRRAQLEDLQTGDRRPLPAHLKAQICRELDRLEMILTQLKTIEEERDALLGPVGDKALTTPAAMLLQIKGIGTEFAAVLWSEGLFRHFDNRRQLAAYAGLAPTPWQSGSIAREQGVSKAGNPRLRTTMIQLAWLWLRNQPDSALSLWFQDRVKRNGGRMKKTTIVALARKLLIALWKYASHGVVIEGAVMKA